MFFFKRGHCLCITDKEKINCFKINNIGGKATWRIAYIVGWFLSKIRGGKYLFVQG